jgi:hypothetical protein
MLIRCHVQRRARAIQRGSLQVATIRRMAEAGLPIRRPSPTIAAGLFAAGGFMNAICRWGFHCGVVLATALFVSAGSNSAFAYTPEQQQACTPDAMRICGAFIPDVDRITACMIQNKSQLSPECRRFFRPGPEPSQRAAGQPVNIKPMVRKTKAKKPKKPAKPTAS